jgi:peptidyl-prolyl cis-trans isomerase D
VTRAEALPGVGQAPELMGMAFASKENSGPQVARSPQAYVVFQVTKVEPPRTPAFNEIKDKVAADFKAERSNELLRKKTQELADRAHSGHDLAKAAKEVGATVKTSDLVTRTSQVPDIGAMSGPASVAFSLKPGEISGALNVGQKGLVLAVTDRQEPSLTDAAYTKERDTLSEQLAQQKREQALGLFLSNLKDRLVKDGKEKINKGEMESLTKVRG